MHNFVGYGSTKGLAGEVRLTAPYADRRHGLLRLITVVCYVHETDACLARFSFFFFGEMVLSIHIARGRRTVSFAIAAPE